VNSTDGQGQLSDNWGHQAFIGSTSANTDLNGFVDEFYMFTKALDKPNLFSLVQACSYGNLFYVYLDFLKKPKTFSIRKLIISYKINNNHIMNHLPHWEKSPKKQSVGVYF